MLATWLARLGTKTRIVDKRFSAIHSGYDCYGEWRRIRRGDLVLTSTQPGRWPSKQNIRSMFYLSSVFTDKCLRHEQIFDSLGIGQDIWREANHMLEIRFWVWRFRVIS